MASQAQANDINNLASFLAHEQLRDLKTHPPVDCIVICASAVLYGAEYVFDVLAARPSLTKTLVLCGGIGHSTHLMYESVENAPRYRSLGKKLRGLPEARVLELMYTCHSGGACPESDNDPRILIEDESTNCGQNASKTRALCEANSISPQSIVVVQDPTMSLRTLASFQKVYSESKNPPDIYTCPTFVPQVKVEASQYVFTHQQSISPLWTSDRFFQLILGEIPRLRDDVFGYGPKGKGFIVKVDIPEDVERSWATLSAALALSR